eukprot:EG_transcript_5964
MSLGLAGPRPFPAIASSRQCVHYLAARHPGFGSDRRVVALVSDCAAAGPQPPNYARIAAELDAKLQYFDAINAAALRGQPAPSSSSRRAVRAVLNTSALRNVYLSTLKQLFPCISTFELRRLILAVDRQHVWAVATALLAGASPPATAASTVVPPEEWFRSPEYKAAVRDSLLNAFPMLWKSQVDGVLAECNDDYVEAFTRCEAINQNREKGWVDWWIRRQRTVPLHPELQADMARLQCQRDHAEATRLNQEQYTALGQALECACCCDGVEAERACACNAGHVLCHDCVQRQVAEGVYTLPRLAPLQCFSCDEPCDQGFPRADLRRALGPTLWAAYERKLVQSALEAAGFGTTACPFCRRLKVLSVPEPPAAPKPPPPPPLPPPPPPSTGSLYPLAWLPVVGLTLLYVPAPYALLLLLLVGAAVRRRRRLRCAPASSPPRGPMEFCLKCFGPGHEGACCGALPATADGLRAYIEEAMAQVMIRVCPECGRRFEKSQGCNHMTCACGATMCYLCRAPLRGIGYDHFCRHFRPNGERRCAAQCSGCDLFHEPDWGEQAILAGREAKQRFLQQHPGLAVPAAPLRVGNAMI